MISQYVYNEDLTFKDLWSHPGSTALVVGHVGLDITGCAEITDLQYRTPHDQE